MNRLMGVMIALLIAGVGTSCKDDDNGGASKDDVRNAIIDSCVVDCEYRSECDATFDRDYDSLAECTNACGELKKIYLDPSSEGCREGLMAAATCDATQSREAIESCDSLDDVDDACDAHYNKISDACSEDYVAYGKSYIDKLEQLCRDACDLDYACYDDEEERDDCYAECDEDVMEDDQADAVFLMMFSPACFDVLIESAECINTLECDASIEDANIQCGAITERIGEECLFF